MRRARLSVPPACGFNMWFLVLEWKFLPQPQAIFLVMSSTIAFQFVDVKANKKYHLKQGKQLIGL